MKNYKKISTIRDLKGFTLIEILMVVAIIGILATIVTAILNTAKSKGADATIKSELNSAKTEIELNYSNSYSNACTIISEELTHIEELSGSTPQCFDEVAGWAVQASLVQGDYWCVDYTGSSKKETAVLGDDVIVCP
jgi:prepilin-type N-terminal cleavage/methylation domain-containing protein